jgi:hypothetical protein
MKTLVKVVIFGTFWTIMLACFPTFALVCLSLMGLGLIVTLTGLGVWLDE